ncbi:MAG: FkbM family methyltransferase [Methylobacteriaceae bacterium]|nr:FkbM family methyltransferase [Methylobacteriaceae bacterium]
MFNASLGETAETARGKVIRTQQGSRGHAVYGPYESLPSGRYKVTFRLEADALGDDTALALVDVAAEFGQRLLAYDFVFASQFQSGVAEIELPFEISDSAALEYRVHVAGSVPLRVYDAPSVSRLAEDASTEASRGSVRTTDLLRHRRPLLKAFYDAGATLRRSTDGMTITFSGVTFNANCYDDVNFVDELFTKSAYNFLSPHDTCVIDVGMNVGLASLLFAAKPFVTEVHSFEPFEETFTRGLANLRLNPNLAAKIKPTMVGLSDADESAIFRVADTRGDSGGQSTQDVAGGIPTRLELREAAAVLRPIVTSARARGLRVVVKVDCEGAEFPLFKSLSRDDLLQEIDALMVEWHRVLPGKDQTELIQPLLDRGFLVFDLTPPSGNGFFYAARLSACREGGKAFEYRAAR